nr:unnamed protein product [Callosobruchus chinensis]
MAHKIHFSMCIGCDRLHSHRNKRTVYTWR